MMDSSDSTDSSKSKECKDVQLPQSRIRIIMKSSPGVENLSQDSVFLTTKATELFIQYLVKRALSTQDGATNKLEYKHIAEVVQTSSEFDFLKEVIPRKMTFKEAQEKAAASRANKIDINEWRRAFGFSLDENLIDEANEEDEQN